MPAVAVPIDAFKITKGAPRFFDTPSLARGHNRRGFCSQCGSRLTGAEHPEHGFLAVAASSLDDPSWFRPKFEIFVADAQPWDLLDPQLPHCEQYPPPKMC